MNPELFNQEHLQEQLPPIPQESVEGWKEKRIKGLNEDMVAIGAFTEFSDCDTSGIYFGERGPGPELSFAGPNNFVNRNIDRDKSLLSNFVRRGVLEKLKRAQELLPKGYYFRFFDTFRPLSVQGELFYAQKIKVEKEHPEWDAVKDKEKIEAETHKFVALPPADAESIKDRPSPHLTGAAIDLGLIKLSAEGLGMLQDLENRKVSGKLNYAVKPKDQEFFSQANEWVEKLKLPDKMKKNWLAEYRYGFEKALIFRKHSKTVDMGTPFDYFGPEATTNFYETKSEANFGTKDYEIKNNRRLFFKVLKDAGFSNYPDEWWHWSYGDQEWAANLKKDEALYGKIDLNEGNMALEKARRMVYLKTIRDVRKNQNAIFIDSEDKKD
ncbi:MAG: M15 family metallopeptidase [Candidatus Magasanikbacteria bacterium]|nr:M15 family metallopeptidase [Candidatus Magasanikbacteria bacterium]